MQILQQVAQARVDLGAQRDAPVGQVTIGLPPSIGRRLTKPLIEGFRAQLPQARITVVEGLSSYIAEWIGSGRADLGLVYNPEPSASLEITPLLREPLCLVQPKQRGNKAVTLPVADLFVPRADLMVLYPAPELFQWGIFEEGNTVAGKALHGVLKLTLAPRSGVVIG